MGKGRIQVCQGCLCWDGGTERKGWMQTAPRRGTAFLRCDSHFLKRTVHPSPHPVVGAARSTHGALGTYFTVRKEPLQSDGNRTYVPGKGPTSQGGMDE